MNSTLHLLKRAALMAGSSQDYASELPAIKCLGLSWHRGLNGINNNISQLLLDHARALDINTHIHALFSGDPVNTSEHRPALHMALRADNPEQFFAPGIASEIQNNRDTVQHWVTSLHKGFSPDGQRITDILHIGIGGSDLSPRLLLDALEPATPSSATPKVHFISAPIDTLPADLNPESTLIVTVSKSFSTVETLYNLDLVNQWLSEQPNGDKALHLAVTANHEAAKAKGFQSDQIFSLWDWVGGRYAFSSAVSLAAAAVMGLKNWQELLSGAAAMDQHMQNTEPEYNLPLQWALHDYWHYVVCRHPARGVFSYDPRLTLLSNWLQQLETESNGKSVDRHHQALQTPSAPLVFGGNGSDAQHAVFQNLHQGKTLVPIEFIGTLPIPTKPASQLRYNNLLAQMQTLHSGADIPDKPWCHLNGGRPVSAIILSQFDATTIGALLAAYEHKTYCYSVLVGCNPFDQWGVEAGKQIARQFGQGQSADLESIRALQKLAEEQT